MAVTAREVVMVFRGQNYLSSAIRRVGRDVQSLSRTQQLTLQRQQLQVVGQRLAQSRRVAQAELDSIQHGARRLSQEKAIAEQSLVQLRHTAQIGEAQVRANRLNRLVGAGRPLRGFTLEETRGLATAANIRVQAASQAIANQQIAVQKLTADEARLIEREAQLTQIINTRSRALELNTAKLNQNALAIRMIPWERFQQGAQYVEHAGRVLQMFGLIAGAALGFAAEQSAKFQTQITLAATQSTLATNNTTRQVLRNAAVLQRAVEQLIAAGTTAKPEELTTGLYTILSGVTLRGNQTQQLQQAVSILGQFNRVLTANYGQVEFNDVVRAGVALINNFGLSAQSLPRVLNRMQASVRFGAMNMRDFVSSLNQVVPAFRGAHFGFDQLAADVAFVSRLFPSLRFGTTGLARLTEILSRQETVSGIKQQLGIDIAPQGRLLPINRIVQDIIKARPELAKGGIALTNFFKTVSGQQGTIQARRVFVGFATQMGLYRTIARQVTGDNNELTKSFTDMSQTPQVRWAELANQLRLFVMQVGAGAIPAFQAFSRPIEQLVHWFNRLSPQMQHTIGYAAGMTAIITLLVGTLAAFVGGIAVLVARGAMLLRFLGLARGGMAALGAEAGLISARLALGLGLVALIPLLIRYHAQINNVVQALGGWNSVLIALTAGLAALRIAPYVLAMAGIATEANTAAAATGSLRLALLSLAGPEVIAAIAAAGTAFLAYKLATAPKAQDISKPAGRPFAESNVVTVDGQRKLLMPFGGFQTLPRGVRSEAEVSRNRAIRQAIADSPRYQHAIRANQTAVDVFAKSLANLDKERFQRRVNVAVQTIQTTPNMLQQIRNIQNLHAEAVRAPNEQAGLAAWTRYENALTTLLEGKSAAQRAAIKAVLNTAILPAAVQQRSVQSWITMIERARARMLGSPNDLRAAQNYEQLVSQLNNRFKDQPALLAAINDVLGNYDNNIKKTTTDANQLGVTFQDVLTRIQSMYQEFQQQEQGLFGTLFQGPLMTSPAQQDRLQFGGRATGRDLLGDLRSQVRSFRSFHRELDQLRRRGAPNELINQLMAQGNTPESMRNLRALGGLSDRDLSDYFRTFRQGQQLIQRQSMRDLNIQLRIYRQHGRNIALAIIAGLRDENVNLTNSLSRMIRRMFPGLPVGATGAGGKPTHTRAQTQTAKADVHVTVHHDEPRTNKPPITKKAAQRHADIRNRNRYPSPMGSPR